MAARQNRKLSHVERYQEQCAFEDAETPYRLCSEIRKLHAAKLPASEIAERIRQLIDQPARGQRHQRDRWLEAARARDSLDHIVEQLRRQARPLKRPRSPLRIEEDFADIDALASSLKVVVKVLLRYEALARPGFFDPDPLNELASVLLIALHISPTIKMMTEARKRAASARQGKATKAQANEQKIVAGAKKAWGQNPRLSVRSIAINMTRRREEGKERLERNTVEKIIAKAVRAGQLKRSR